MRPPSSPYREIPKADLKTVIIHYTTGQELGQPNSPAWWKAIQHYHMDERNMIDVAYNAAVDQRGSIFEGRPINAAGGHTSGYNTRATAFVFLGNDDADQIELTPSVKQAFLKLIDFTKQNFPISQVLTHRMVSSTGCPGDEIHAWVKAGLPYTGETNMVAVAFYAKRGTRDRNIASDLYDIFNTGAVFNTLTEAKAEKAPTLFVVGNAAVQEYLNGAEPSFSGVKRVNEPNGTVTVLINGKTGGETALLAFEEMGA